MAHIVPFKGLRYNSEKIASVASVVTPPYDIIDDAAQARYYAEHPANVIRLELGLIFPQDTSSNNRYTRAQQYLEKWLEDEILAADSKPTLYLYEQEFIVKGTKMIRTGMVCGLKVEPYETGTVLPHEETLSKPKADRLALMRATRSNFSSIFGLYSDPQNEVINLLRKQTEGRLPDIDMVDEAGETHRIWIIQDEAALAEVIKLFQEKQIFIADGHHRYETALEYAREMREQGYTNLDFVLTTLVNLYDEGLVVLPTHRVVGNITNLNMAELQRKLSQLFEVETFGTLADITALMKQLESQVGTEHVFGMVAGDNLYQLRLKDSSAAAKLLPSDRSSAWKELDVAILDNLILDRMLGIGEAERRNQDHLAYSRSEEWVLDQVRSKQYQLGFLINATRVQEIVDVAQARDKMPQKSTYFYPKLITGLIINKLDI